MGSATRFASWDKTARVHNRQGLRALKRKRWADAVKRFQEALAAQPDNSSQRWNLACAHARAGQPDQALAQLDRVLHADYARFAPRTKTDPDLAPLRLPPHQAKLVTLVSDAKTATLATLRHAHLLLVTTRPIHLAEHDDWIELKGSQHLFGYLPGSGRYLQVPSPTPDPGITDLIRRTHVVAFYHRPAEDLLLLASVYQLAWIKQGQDMAFRFQIQVVQASTLTPLRSFTDWTYYPQKLAQSHSSGQSIAAYRINLSRHTSGLFRFAVHWNHRYGDGPKGRWSTLGGRVQSGKWHPADKRPPSSDPRTWLVSLARCGSSGGLPGPAGVKAGQVVARGAKATFPCAGKAWRAPNSALVAFQPGARCAQPGKPSAPMTGLWIRRSRGGAWLHAGDHRATKIRWLDRGRLFAQVGRRVLYVDSRRGRSTLLAPSRAYVQHSMPHLMGCK